MDDLINGDMVPTLYMREEKLELPEGNFYRIVNDHDPDHKVEGLARTRLLAYAIFFQNCADLVREKTRV